MKPALHPYLLFNGNCREAMQFYQSVLGGELKMQTYEEAKVPVSGEEKKNIIHASLENGGLTFMASDGDREHQVKMGDNFAMSISGDDEPALTKYFNELAKGGKIETPLKKEFWGDIFGMLIDKFAVRWMIDISLKKDQNG